MSRRIRRRRRTRQTRNDYWFDKVADRMGLPDDGSLPYIANEEFQLQVDGSGDPVIFRPKKPFVVINTVQFSMEWAANQFSWGEFANVTELAEGIEIFQENNSDWRVTINDNEDWKRYSFQTEIDIDTLGTTKLHVLTAQLNLSLRIFRDFGLPVWRDNLCVAVKDDLTALTDVTDIEMVVSGWKWGRSSG